MPHRQTLEHLLASLTLERQDELSFTAQNAHPGAFRLYGGQVLAQAMRAAYATVDGAREVHSQHAYFLRPGDSSRPVELAVDIARDGISFSSRRVTASQRGRIIFVSSLSFQATEKGDSLPVAMPDVPPPEELVSERERVLDTDLFMPEFQVVDGLDLDVRVVEPVDWQNPTPRPGLLHAWMKTTGPVPEERGLHSSLLAYLSDAFLVDVALLPNGRSFFDGVQTASLDHALWIHQPVRADDWLLLEADVQSVGASRGLGRGRFYNRQGDLVATCMQESLQRIVK